MGIAKLPFGIMEDGRQASLYRLSNAAGAYVDILDYGGTIVDICVPDKSGNIGDVCLGCSDIKAYEHTSGYLGALIGRYGNRIGKGHFTMGGQEYQLDCNSNGQHLHGGYRGFNYYLWNAAIEGGALVLTLTSPDGDQKYPGTLNVKVTYEFSDANELSLHYEATTDKLTVCNLTNHCYFNLSGYDSGCICEHTMQILADEFTVVDADSIPTGEQRDVTGTPFDLRQPKVIKVGLALEHECEQLKLTGGYDHNFVIPGVGMRKCAEVCSPATGRVMEVFTDAPGVQFYAGNMLDGTMPIKGQAGKAYTPRCGFCLETQYYPDSVNHAEWPQPFLAPGEKYDTKTVYKFSVR